jgi:hypothetical protein
LLSLLFNEGDLPTTNDTLRLSGIRSGRLTLGSIAYEHIDAALRNRLAALEATRELAYSTDADDIIAAR